MEYWTISLTSSYETTINDISGGKNGAFAYINLIRNQWKNGNPFFVNTQVYILGYNDISTPRAA